MKLGLNVPRMDVGRDRGLTANCELTITPATPLNNDALHSLKHRWQLAQSFTNALLGTTTAKKRPPPALDHGNATAPEVIWHQQGNLASARQSGRGRNSVLKRLIKEPMHHPFVISASVGGTLINPLRLREEADLSSCPYLQWNPALLQERDQRG